MSDDDKPSAPTATDVGYFSDADDLDTGLPKPVADPDAPPPVDTVDTSPAPAAAAPDRDGLAAAVRAAFGDDAAAGEALDRLASSGRLDAPGLAAALAALAARPRAPVLMLSGIDPKLVVAQLVRHLDNPLRVTQGRGRGTCGAATMEYLLLRAEPAEVVRLVDGLTGREQAATTRGGGSLSLPATAIPRDDSGRVDLDRLFQSALMNHATSMSALFDYDNTKDHGDFWSAIQGNSLVPVGGFVSLYDDLTGEPHRAESTGSIDAGGVMTLLSLATEHGERPAVLTAFGGPQALHWLALEKMDPAPTAEGKRWVYLRNPWGEDDGTGEPTRWPLPDGGGRIGIERDVFAGILRGAVLKRPV